MRHMKRRMFLRSMAAVAASSVAGCGARNSTLAESLTERMGRAQDALEGSAGALERALAQASERAHDAGKPVLEAARQPVPRPSGFPKWASGRHSYDPSTVLMFRGNPRRAFYGTGPLGRDLMLRWYRPTETFMSTGADGVTRRWGGIGWTGQPVRWGQYIFVGSNDANLYCWDADRGEEVWRMRGGRMFKSSCAFYRDHLYVGNVDDQVRCVNAVTGREVWAHDTGRDCDSSPVVFDDTVWVAGESGYLRALDPYTGELLAAHYVGGLDGPLGSNGAESSPAIDRDDVYVGTYDGRLMCISRTTGVTRWTFGTGGDTDVTAVVTDRYVYTAAEEENPYLFCIDRETGREVWRRGNRTGWWSTPAVADGHVFAGSNDGQMICLEATTGEEQWVTDVGAGVWSSPSVVDGRVVFGDQDGNVYLLRASDGMLLWGFPTGRQINASPCIVDGRVYLGNDDGMFCFGPTWR